MAKSKVQVIVTDETGKDIPFGSKTLTKEFAGKEGKTYKVAIQEPGSTSVNVGNYTVKGGVIPPIPDNKPPIVNAGEDQTVKQGDLVTLVASDSDEDGIITVESWRQEQGPVVVLVFPNPKTATFTAPFMDTELVFAFTAKDDKGAEVSDKMRVTVGTIVPPPVEGLIYDSNTDIDWGAITGEEFLKVTDIYGTFKPNGKYFRMKASGKPRMYLYPATKELVLEHDGKYGRAYFGVCNYASRLECEFKLESCDHNASFKTRNRHQFADVQSGAPDNKRQGGQGSAFRCDSVDADLEVVHGTEIGGPQSSYPKLEAGKYYKIKFSQFDKNGKIHIVDELDRDDGQGFKVVNEGDIAAPSQFFNKAEFEEWSEFWVRLNADAGGKLYFKNLKMYKL